MDRLVYVAMTGAKHTMEQQAVVAHNLANASTTGFKAEMATFRAVPTLAAGMPTRSYVVDATVGADFSEGPIIQTGNPLDIAVKGRGWIAVQGPDGREAYTRDGGLTLNPNGILQTHNGLNVLGEGGSITVPPNSTVAIADDGTVSAIPTDGVPNAVAVLGRIKLVNPPESNLERRGDGLFVLKDGQQALPPDANVQITSGALEGSNVSSVEMLVEMIAHARQFETQVRMMQTADQAARGWSQVMNLA